MSLALQKLLALLTLKKISTLDFIGENPDVVISELFGGQLIGQAISAAYATVDPDRGLHSIHSHFIRPGDGQFPVCYKVENIRDGKSFSIRHVDAFQGEHLLFRQTCSFQLAENGLDFQTEMPEVPEPESLTSQQILARKWADNLPRGLREILIRDPAIEMKAISFVNPLKDDSPQKLNNIWFKANGEVTKDRVINHALLGYLSDFNLLSSALLPHGIGFLSPNIQIVSLDHAMWFHRPVNLEHWHLYHIEPLSNFGNRGLARGQIFSRSGELIASCMQEGSIRLLSNTHHTKPE